MIWPETGNDFSCKIIQEDEFIMSEHNLHTTTLAVHAGSRKDDAFGAINEPVYMTSNYRITIPFC